MKSLAGKNIVVFDLEIKEVIGKNGVTWGTFDKMGISVGCLFDFQTMDNSVYMDDNISQLTERLNVADLVVGFNITGFDLKLLAADPLNTVKIRENLKIYDILYWSRRSLGWDETRKFPTGLKLDDHLLAMFGPTHMKTSHGSEAPMMWQSKRLGHLTTYCLNDVKRESMLFRKIWDEGRVCTPQHGWRQIERPELWHQAVA
jgi:DEAD/DEAH box helicase domain-containing protein